MIYMHSQPFKMTCKTVKTRDLGRVAEIPHAILHLPHIAPRGEYLFPSKIHIAS